MATAAIDDSNKPEYKLNKEKIKSLFQPIDNDVRKNIDANKSPKEFEDQLKKYTKELDAILDELQSATGKSLDKETNQKFKQLIVREHYYKVRQEVELAKFNENTKDVSKIDVEPIPTDISKDKQTNTITTTYSANLPANTYYPIHNFVQVNPDVYGGKGRDSNINPFNVNGNNNLYQIGVENGKNCIFTWCYAQYTKYTLYFYDEDHPDPTIDILYDYWRQLYYGRIQDVESFVVTNGIIDFNGIWDNNRAYAEFYGQHGGMTRSYATNSKIYVSNVWNHAMDTVDKNSDMTKVQWNY
jgi:hypothetical protein